MIKLKFLLLSNLINRQEITCMASNQMAIHNQTGQMLQTNDDNNSKMRNLFLYKLFDYGTSIGILGLLVLSFVNFFFDNTKTVMIDKGTCDASNFCTLDLTRACTTTTDCQYSIVESTQNTLGLILQLALGLLAALSICLKTGFNCTFSSIIKCLITVYGLILGALSLSGILLKESTLAGLTGNGNITTSGLIVSFLDVGLSLISLFATVAYHFTVSTTVYNRIMSY
jgi:hypothetical protein